MRIYKIKNYTSSVNSSFNSSLEPRLTFGGRGEPDTHCLRMRQNSQKSWEFVFLYVYQSINVDLDLISMSKNYLCWPLFGLRTLVATRLVVTSEQH